MRILTLRNHVLVVLAVLVAVAVYVGAQTNGQAAGSPTPQTDAGKPSSPTADEVLSFLNQTIVWSSQLNAEQQFVNEPSDAVFLNDNRQVADEIVRLAFDFARARAQALAGQSNAGEGNGQTAVSQYQRLYNAANQADARVKQSQAEIESVRAQLTTATGKKRTTLQASLDENQSELDLFQARRDALRSMLQFAVGTTTGGANSGTLAAHVEELARTVPAAAAANAKEQADSNTKTANASATAASVRERKESPNGILPLATDLFALRRKLHVLETNIQQTDKLSQTVKNIRTPLISSLKALTQKGDAVSTAPDSQDPAVLAQQRKDLDAVTQQFKQLAASFLPLGKQNILLEVYVRNSKNWRDAVDGEYDAELKGLLLRLGGLALILAVVFGISALWRRAIYRYVPDVRRRYQFLLIRRIVLWFLVAIIIAAAFASELGAITTFAGLMTAGIAVALQNVILSIAGYFFLIGKYGLRVGDRVQIADVTGDVVDIGLVRLHIMEVTRGPAPLPTGRVVAFSNAVVFQANAGMFKQIPGTNFVWHEITLTLESHSNYRQVEQRIMAAVNKVFGEYHDKMEQQRQNVERSLNSTFSTFKPETRLHLTQASLELVVRYPVELGHAGEIDDKVTREILSAIQGDPNLRSQVSGIPILKTEEQQPAEPVKT